MQAPPMLPLLPGQSQMGGSFVRLVAAKPLHVGLGAISAIVGHPLLPAAYLGFQYATQRNGYSFAGGGGGGDSSCPGVILNGFLYGVGYYTASLLIPYLAGQ